MRTYNQEEAIKSLAKEFWIISGKQSGRDEEFYHLAEKHIVPHLLFVFTCECCGKHHRCTNNLISCYDFTFCSEECRKSGPR